MADLAARYTAEATADAAPGAADGRSTAERKAQAEGTKLLMGSLLACFELLAPRQVTLANTIVWIFLGAAETGELGVEIEADAEAAGGEAVVEAVRGPSEATLRCVRFLASLLRPTPGGAQVLDGIATATLLNLTVQHHLHLPHGEALVQRWLV